jgi:hypothetical protein
MREVVMQNEMPRSCGDENETNCIGRKPHENDIFLYTFQQSQESFSKMD